MPTRSFATPSNRGQSLVETVVFLPVFIMLFLGLDYFFSITAARSRAVEAARLGSWESAWFLRDKGTGTGNITQPSSNLNARLTNLRLDRALISSNANAKSRTVNTFFTRITEPALFTTQPRPGVANILVPLASGGQFSGLLSGLINSAGGFLGPAATIIGGVGGTGGAIAQDTMARFTAWDGEADRSIYTTRVQYRFIGAGFFHLLPTVNIVQFSSVLSHPFLIVRSNDQTEYEQLVGTQGLGDCFGNFAKGHIFDLWMFPSGQVGPPFAGSILGAGKCAFQSISSALSALDGFAGTSLGFRLPDGTLKEFPERRDPLNP